MFDYEWDQQRARSLIGRLVERTGLSATEVARSAGLAPSTLTRIYPVPSVDYSLSARSIAKLKAAFPDDFTAAAELQETPTSAPILRERFIPFAAPSHNSIPVYSTTLLFPEENGLPLSKELELWQGDFARPAAYMPIPFGQADVERYFAIYIPSEAMEPRFRAGERVILDRIKPASIDTDALVQLRGDDGEMLWTVGRLRTRDRNLIGLTQYRDNIAVSIHRSKIAHIFPIIAMLNDDGI